MWVFNTDRDGADITVRIGAIPIAHIILYGGNPRWKAYLRFSDLSLEGVDCENVGQAMHLIHHYLNSPPDAV